MRARTTITIAVPGVAEAASAHSIAGTTWSDNLKWYTSTNVRTKSGDGNVTIRFSSLPRFSDGDYDYLKWQYIDNSDGSVVGGSAYNFSSVNTTYTNWYLFNGFQFRNSFARGTFCDSGCDHDFSGTQTY